MAGIYVYPHDCRDFSTTGLVGELTPLECYFEEEKNGASGISIRMYYDEKERWKAFKVGNFIKAEVPVRTPQMLVDGEYADTVTVYEARESLDLQQFAVKLDLQKHASTIHYIDLLAPIDDPEIKVSQVGAFELTEKFYADGRIEHAWRKIIPATPTTKATGYVRPNKVQQVDTRQIPARFNGLEATLVPTRVREQFFEIDSVIENEDYIEISASHLWYQLLKNFTTYKPEETAEVKGFIACEDILANAIVPVKGFNVQSDIDTTQKGLDYNQKNIVEAFLDPENGICAKYNAVLLRDNWDFYVLKESNVGYDRGFVVEYGQNLLSVERSESIENVATRIVPFGKDKKGNPVYMTGTKWIDSDYIDDYPVPMVELLDCSSTCTIGKDGVTEQNITQKLRAEAQKRFDDDKVDIPAIEMTINFLSLGDTEEYSQYRGLDKVYLYDKITVKDTKRGYTFAAQVNYVKHNVLTGMLEEVKIGSIENSDGTRKIATWQVPTVNGENIRLKSIQLGSFADGAVDEDAIANGAITTIHLASATIDDLTTESLEAVQAQIEDLIAGHVTAESIVAGAVTADAIAAGAITSEKIDSKAVTADKIDAGAISADKIAANAITAGKIAANAVGANQIQAGTITANSGIIANGAITNAMIGTGAVNTAQIADGSITDAKIVGLTANKITAGTLDAGTIEVVNLNAANITVGKINGQQIANGAVALTNLASGVQTSIGKISTIESDIETLQREVDASIETFYYAYFPTLNNIPASQWTTEALKEKHQGDLFFDSAHGQAYRFLKLNNVWQWKLIEDSDVTELLSRVNTLEANMTTVQGGLTTVQGELAEVADDLDDVASDLATTKTNLQSVTGRLTTAEQTITTKANQSTVTSLSNTVAGHKESLESIEDRVDTVESTVETKADASTVTTLSQTVASHTTSIGSIEDRVETAEEAIETKADASTVNTLANTVASHTTSIDGIEDRVESAEQTLETKANSSTVNTLSNTVAGHTTSINGISSRLTTAESTLTQKADGSTVTALSNTVSQHSVAIGEIDDRVSDAEATLETKADGSTVQTLSNTVASHTTSINGINSRLTTAEQSLTTKADGSTVQTLSSTVAGHTTSINGISSRVTTAEQAITTKADGSTVTALSNTVAGHTTSINGLSSRIETAEEEIETKADGSTVTELSERVTEVEETTEGITSTVSALDTRVTTAQSTANSASSAASAAQTKANSAYAAAEVAQESADNAQSTADSATSVASAAQSTANSASSAASAAQTKANSAASAAEAAQESADNAQETANSATTAASAAQTAANTAQTTANNAQTAANNAQTTANSKNKVYSGTTKPTSGMSVGDLFIETNNNNKQYRWSGSAWVSVQDTHLDSVVSTHTTQIQQHTDAIALKASQSDLSALTGRVASAEATIAVHADEIESKVSETDFTGTTIASKINQSSSTVQIEAQHINLVGAVTANDLAAGAVTTDKIAANAITSAKIAAEAITSDKIVAEAITAEKIAAEAVTADAIVSGAITTDKLDASAVTADKIAAGTVTLAKLASNVGQGIDISANTYLQSTIGSWTSTHENTIVDEIAGINRTIGELGRGQIFFSTTEPSDPAVGDIWIKPTFRLTHADLATYTHAELAEFRYMDLGRPPEQYVYNGNGWEMINDSSMYTVLQTQLEQTDEKIALKASIDQLGLTNDRVTAAEAELEIQAESIASEVVARQSGDAEAEANAKAACIAKTSTLQTADQIVDSAKTYTDGQLTNYSTLTQTSQQISAAVAATTKTFRQASAPTSGMHDGDLWFDSDDGNKPYRYNGSSWVATDDTKKYTVQSGIDINANGVDISGGKYIRMKTGNQTNLELSPSGIQMNTAGQFNVHAQDQKGSIVFGTSESNATFAVGEQGNLHAESVDTDALTVNGLTLPGIVVSESQPSGHGILWIKPSSTTEKSWVYTPEQRALDQVGGTLGRYRDYQIQYSAQDYLAGSLFYGIIASLYVYSSTAVGRGFNFKAILNPASQNITIGTASGRVYTAGTNIELNVMMSSLQQNVLSPSGGYMTIRLETDCDPTWCRLDRSITVKAKSQSGSGVSACSVFYVS